ncbi:MAG: aminotransferase class I/II-fold pyridoxal phosphate-dependent enzyme [Zetaproteobacteria bacterium]|nr:MAG: aminotransferase class I/II-fold pyridoxal phosphate-dependent enzyme [Zetaproteobacteria bacterium]
MRLVLAERERLEEALGERGLLAARSFGNFVLMKLADAASARAWAEKLEAQGVITRPLAPYGMGAYLRVTVGTPEENARFLEAVDAILDQGV